jgi:hypothetical protein
LQDDFDDRGERPRRDPLGDLQARIEAAVDEVRPKIKRALEELDAKVDAAVADIRPRAQSAMRDVQPKVDQFVADLQPRLDTLIERIQTKLEDLRRDLDARAARTRQDTATTPPAQIGAATQPEPGSDTSESSAGGL